VPDLSRFLSITAHPEKRICGPSARHFRAIRTLPKRRCGRSVRLGTSQVSTRPPIAGLKQERNLAEAGARQACVSVGAAIVVHVILMAFVAIRRIFSTTSFSLQRVVALALLGPPGPGASDNAGSRA